MKPDNFAASLALFFLVLMSALAAASHAAGSQSPLGLWKTFDDKTGKPLASVRIYLQDGRYFGRIEQSLLPEAVCSACTDERKNQPILGLLIIRNMALRDADYSGGDILDPDSGSVYRCKFHLGKDGNTLVVRSFIGLPLFGRSQTWRRQS
jgi:uncharacterized protein (DUF2147 family)